MISLCSNMLIRKSKYTSRPTQLYNKSIYTCCKCLKEIIYHLIKLIKSAISSRLILGQNHLTMNLRRKVISLEIVYPKMRYQTKASLLTIIT